MRWFEVTESPVWAHPIATILANDAREAKHWARTHVSPRVCTAAPIKVTGSFEHVRTILAAGIAFVAIFLSVGCGITLRVQSSTPVRDECRGGDLYHGEELRVFRARSCAGEK